MTNFHTINDSRDYMNYFFNIGSRGVTETTAEIMGMSNTIRNALGNLAFKTSEYLGQAESVATGFGLTTIAAFTSATKSAMEFQQAVASVEAISGKQLSGGAIGEKAMAMSNKFGLATTEMTQGLEALARAGITANESINALLESGVQMTKFEGRDLEESINDILATTNLLNPDINPDTDEFAQTVRDLNQTIISTSESSPINAKNIIDTLQHVGGYAAATSLDQEDLFATIAQLGAKGTKGEIAGTSLRAFISAGQKDTAQRALDRIGLKVTDLWSESGENILPLSEMKRVLDEALDAKGFSKQEKIEFYSDFVGYKQANQVMKIDPEGIDEYKNKINNAMSLTDKMNIILGTVKGNWSQISQIATNFMTRVGNKFLPILNMILVPTKYLLKLVTSIPFLDWGVAIGGSIAAVSGLSVLFNNLVPTIFTFVNKFIDFQEMFNNKQKTPLQIVFENIKQNLTESREILSDIMHLRIENLDTLVNDREAHKTNKLLVKKADRDTISEFQQQVYGYRGWIPKIDKETKKGKVYSADGDVIAHIEDGQYTITKNLKHTDKYGQRSLHAKVGDVIKDEKEFEKLMDKVYGEGMKGKRKSIWAEMDPLAKEFVMNKFRPNEDFIKQQRDYKIMSIDASYKEAYLKAKERKEQGFPYYFAPPMDESYRPIENLEGFSFENLGKSVKKIEKSVEDFYKIFQNDYTHRTQERERNERTGGRHQSVGYDPNMNKGEWGNSTYDETVIPTINNALNRIEDFFANGQIIVSGAKKGALGESDGGNVIISPNSIAYNMKQDSDYGKNYGSTTLETTIHELMHTLMQQKYRESDQYKGNLSITNLQTDENRMGYHSGFVAEVEANYGTKLFLDLMGIESSKMLNMRLQNHQRLLESKGLNNEIQFELIDATVNELAHKGKELAQVLSSMIPSIDTNQVDASALKSLQDTIHALEHFKPGANPVQEFNDELQKLVSKYKAPSESVIRVMRTDKIPEDIVKNSYKSAPKINYDDYTDKHDDFFEQLFISRNSSNPVVKIFEKEDEKLKEGYEYNFNQLAYLMYTFSAEGLKKALLGIQSDDWIFSHTTQKQVNDIDGDFTTYIHEVQQSLKDVLKGTNDLIKTYKTPNSVKVYTGGRGFQTYDDGIGVFSGIKSTSFNKGKAGQFGKVSTFYVPEGANAAYTNWRLEDELTFGTNQPFITLDAEKGEYLILTQELIEKLQISNETIQKVQKKKDLEVMLSKFYHGYGGKNIHSDMNMNIIPKDIHIKDYRIDVNDDIENILEIINLVGDINGFINQAWEDVVLVNGYKLTDDDVNYLKAAQNEIKKIIKEGAWHAHNVNKHLVLQSPIFDKNGNSVRSEYPVTLGNGIIYDGNSFRVDYDKQAEKRLQEAIKEYHAFINSDDVEYTAMKNFLDNKMAGYNKTRYASAMHFFDAAFQANEFDHPDIIKNKVIGKDFFRKGLIPVLKEDENAPRILKEVFLKDIKNDIIDNKSFMEELLNIDWESKELGDVGSQTDFFMELTKYAYTHAEDIYKKKGYSSTQMARVLPSVKIKENDFLWIMEEYGKYLVPDEKALKNNETYQKILNSSSYQKNLKKYIEKGYTEKANLFEYITGWSSNADKQPIGIKDQRKLLAIGLQNFRENYADKFDEFAKKYYDKHGQHTDKNGQTMVEFLKDYYVDNILSEIALLSPDKPLMFGTKMDAGVLSEAELEMLSSFDIEGFNNIKDNFERIEREKQKTKETLELWYNFYNNIQSMFMAGVKAGDMPTMMLANFLLDGKEQEFLNTTMKGRTITPEMQAYADKIKDMVGFMFQNDIEGFNNIKVNERKNKDNEEDDGTLNVSKLLDDNKDVLNDKYKLMQQFISDREEKKPKSKTKCDVCELLTLIQEDVADIDANINVIQVNLEEGLLGIYRILGTGFNTLIETLGNIHESIKEDINEIIGYNEVIQINLEQGLFGIGKLLEEIKNILSGFTSTQVIMGGGGESETQSNTRVSKPKKKPKGQPFVSLFDVEGFRDISDPGAFHREELRRQNRNQRKMFTSQFNVQGFRDISDPGAFEREEARRQDRQQKKLFATMFGIDVEAFNRIPPKSQSAKEEEEAVKKEKRKEKFKTQLEAFKEIIKDNLEVIQGYTEKAFNKLTDSGVKKYSDAMNTISSVTQNVSDKLNIWKGYLQDLADVFPMLQAPIAGLTMGINKVEKIRNTTKLIDKFMKKDNQEMIKELFGETFAQTEMGQAMQVILLPAIKKLIRAGIGYLVTAMKVIVRILMGPVGIVVAAVAAIAGTLKIIQKIHDNNLEKLQKQQEQNDANYNSAKISYQSAKTELNKPYLTPQERERAEIRYDTNKAELEYANMKKQTGAMDVQKSKDSYLWGEYGLRASTQKILRGHLVGEFESQAENYDGISKNIREIKESTLGSLDTAAQRKVAQYYDANSQVFAIMDSYKDDLGELYDYETKLVKMYGSLEAARASSFYQNKLAEKSEITGISEENLKQYLDWMQTEHNVDVAKSTMKGRANQIVAETEMKALAVANGADLADAMGLNGIEEQQRAMVKAQADMIKQEAADTLWWKAFWSGLSAMFWKIVSPITFIANLLTYMWKVISSLDIIIYDAVTLGKGPMSSGDKARLEEVREARGDVANSVADFFMNGREAKKARTYYQGYKQIEKENLEELGNRSISEADRANYGNDTSMNTHAYGGGASIVPNPTYNQFKQEGQNASQGFRDGLNQHSPGDIANAINDEFGFMQDFISKFSISDVFHRVGKKATKGFKNGLNQHSPGDISQSVGDIGIGISGQPIRGYRQGYGTIISNILVHTRKISKNTNDISKGINPNMTEWYKQGHSGEDGSLSRRIKNSFLYNQGIGLPEGVNPDDPEVKAEQRKRQAQTLAKTGGNVLGGWGLSRDGTPKGFKPFKIIRWAYQQITGQALEDTISQVYKSIMGEGAETAAKSAGKSGAKKIAIEGGDEAAEKIAINVGKKAARDGAEIAAKKVGKEGAESAAKSVVKKAGINALKGAVPLIGPLITAGISAYEHNPFETHYNEDGTEKRALQSTGEFTGEVLGSVGAEAVQTLAAGNPLVGAAASMILEPLGEAVGGTMGWMLDEVVNGNPGALFYSTWGMLNHEYTSETAGKQDEEIYQDFQASLTNTPTGSYTGAQDISQTTTNSNNNSKTEINIENININTEDDPDSIKTKLMEMFIELQEDITPKNVSRTVGGESGTTNTATGNNGTTNTGTQNGNQYSDSRNQNPI